MSDFMHFAFLDESGTISVPGGTHFFVVALLSTGKPRDIELPVRRALKKYGPSLRRGEIKAANFEEKAIARLLTEIAKEDILIFATIVDQSVIGKPPKEMEEIYRQAVSRTIYKLVERFPRVNICLDRRYTNERQRFKLESQIRESIQDLPQKVVLIRQENSMSRKELQAADAVAWALFQKYERDNASFYNIISSKIIDEEIIQKEKWTK
jgi:DNA gyrase/topoisomerase IV subunit B